jgi:type VI secretion system secreted protein VgrG
MTPPPPTATGYTQDRRSIAIQTPLGKDAVLLRTLRGEEGVSRLFRFELDLLSPQPTIDAAAVMGKAATVGVRRADGSDRFFNGIVSRLALVGGEGPFTIYRAEMVPWTWLLTRTTDCRVFQNLPVPAIVEKVFKDLGFQDFKNQLQKTYPPREYCVQYRETDFNFVSRLMEQNGIYYYFEHENGKHTLVMSDVSTENPAFPGFEKARYRASKEEKYEAEVVSSWAQSLEIRPTKYALGAYNFETPNVNLGVNVDSMFAAENGAKYEVYDFPGGYAKRVDGEGLVKLRIEEQEAQMVTIRGTSTCRGLAPGSSFELVDHPHKEQNQKYLVTAVVHSVSESSYLPGGKDATGPYKNTFSAIPLKTPYRPVRATPRPVVYGVQTAVVVGKKGEEFWVDKHGRVKVQFFWDREGKRDENSSCWVRVSQNWAGRRWGAMFLPRIGQEVIVEFLEGDPDNPIITGRVYNGDQAPPYVLPGEQTKTTVKSSTSKGGAGFNELRFDDKKGAEQIFVHGQRDLDFVVERQSRELVGEERHFIVTASRFEEVGQEHNLKIGTDLIEQVGGTRFTSAEKSIFVRAGSSIVLETGGEITLKAGGGFITIGSGGVNIVGSIVNINSGGAAGSGEVREARTPNRAASGAAGGGPGEVPTDEGGGPTDADLERVELYRATYEQNKDKLSEEDRQAYLQALKELEDATRRGDQAGIAAAKAKLDAILTKNRIPIPPDPAESGTTTPPVPGPGAPTGGAPNTYNGPPVRLRVDKNIFRTPDGTPWRYKAVTAFKAPLRWERGENLGPFVNWTRAVGANGWRVFLQHRFLDYPQINPYIMPLEKVRPFVDFVRAQGLYVELTVLCDSQVRNPGEDPGFGQTDDECIARVRGVLDAVRGADNVLVEIMNEPFANGGADRVRRIIDALGLRSPANRPVPMAAGIYPDTGAEPLSEIVPLDYVGDHPPRKPTWPTESGKIGFYVFRQTGVAHLHDEPIRFGENRNDGQEISAENAEDAGGGIALSSAGGTFHSNGGVQTVVPGPIQTEGAKRFFGAMDLIPGDAPTWRYEHDGTGGHPLVAINDERIVGEVTSRVNPAGNLAYAVAAQPTSAWRATAREGWRIASVLNPRGTILRLER